MTHEQATRDGKNRPETFRNPRYNRNDKTRSLGLRRKSTSRKLSDRLTEKNRARMAASIVHTQVLGQQQQDYQPPRTGSLYAPRTPTLTEDTKRKMLQKRQISKGDPTMRDESSLASFVSASPISLGSLNDPKSSILSLKEDISLCDVWTRRSRASESTYFRGSESLDERKEDNSLLQMGTSLFDDSNADACTTRHRSSAEMADFPPTVPSPYAQLQSIFSNLEPRTVLEQSLDEAWKQFLTGRTTFKTEAYFCFI